MDKNKFTTIMDLIDKVDKRNSILYDEGIDVLEYCDSYHAIIHELGKAALGEDGWSWVEYYLYEIPLFDSGEDGYHAKRIDGSPIYLRNIDELYNYLKEIGSV